MVFSRNEYIVSLFVAILSFVNAQINHNIRGTLSSSSKNGITPTTYDDTDDTTDDGSSNEVENEIIFVAIVAAILICGCGCLSGNCTSDNPRDARNEPLLSRDDQRIDIFSNSLSGEENEWLCPVCSFENRPRANQCSLCGASRNIAVKYYETMRKRQQEEAIINMDLPRLSDESTDDNFRVTMVAPKSFGNNNKRTTNNTTRTSMIGIPENSHSSDGRSSFMGRGVSSSGDAFSSSGGGLSQGERREAFMVRRFNELTLRQRAAHRRRLWQRQTKPNGEFEWVRVSVPVTTRTPTSSSSLVSPRSSALNKESEIDYNGGPPSSESLLPSASTTSPLLSDQDQVEPNQQRKPNYRRDSFGDSSHMSYSPGFTSVLNTESPGDLDWKEVTGVKNEKIGPIKQHILKISKGEGSNASLNSSVHGGRGSGVGNDNDSTRSSIPILEIDNSNDLIYIASLPFRRKQQWLQSFLDSMRAQDVAIGQPTSGVVKVQVRRDNMLGDSFSQIMSLDPSLLARRLRIVFVDEPGIDAGGLLREWFMLVTQQLFDAQFGLFYLQGNDAGYTINPISGLCNPLHLKYFRFVGRFIGKSILEHQTLPAHLSLPILKHVLSVPISFSDLEFVDGELYQNLVYLRDNPGAEYLDLDFTVEVEHMGMRQTHELVPGGVNIAVTDSNKQEYLNRRFKFRMLDSISPQLWQLLCGLYEVVPMEVLSVFDYQELELLISGVPEIDLDDWMRHSRYVGLYKKLGPKHHVCEWFWEVVSGFTHEERARLLQFTTGTTRLPAQGFKALEANDGNFRLFTISGVSKVDFLYPRAHTCFNRIDLPLYDSKEELEGFLTLVINMEITGFSDE